MKKNKIITILKHFFKNSNFRPNDIQFDDTFLKQYKLTDKKLKEILWN